MSNDHEPGPAAETRVATAAETTFREAVYREARDELAGVIASIVGDRDEARELAQEAGMKLVQQPPGSVRDARAFLFFVGANLAKDALRRAHVRHEYARAVAAQDEPYEPSAESDAESRCGVERIEAAMAQLTERGRQVVWHARIEGRTNAETARLLGLSEKTVEKHLYRAIATLAQLLRGAGRENAP